VSQPNPEHSRDQAVRVGISVPFDLWRLDDELRRRRLAAVADAGIDHLFTADHVSFHDGSGMDGLITLAGLSGIEPRLGLQVGVYLLALRHPMAVARQIATLAQIAPGRITVGVGVGGEDRHEIEVCDVDPRRRGSRTDVSLDIVRALLAGESVDGDGDHFRFTGGLIRPVPDPPVPFLVGGRSPAALRRAARHGQGWLAAWCSPRRFGEGVQQVEEAGAHREVPWWHGLQVWIGVGTDKNDGRRHVADRMQDFYRMDFARLERYTPVGTPDQIAAELAPYVGAGATTLNLAPCGADRDAEIKAVGRIKELLS